MTRRRDSYLGGSTVHIPGRDFAPSSEGPLQALAQAQDRNRIELEASSPARAKAAELLNEFKQEALAHYREVKAAKTRDGSSLALLKGMNWKVRLGDIVSLARAGGDLDLAKATQHLMGRMAKAERDLRANASAVAWEADKTNRKPNGERYSWDSTRVYEDSVFWKTAFGFYLV